LDAELRHALARCRGSFFAAGFFSLFINLLMLVPSFYMLEVYDRVLPSNSEPTLLVLTLITVFLFLVMGGLDWIRGQILIVAGTRLERSLGGRVFDAVFKRTLATGGRIASAQPIGDLAQLRQFLASPGLLAFFDAPWVPIYVAVMFLFHPAYGAVAVVSALVLLALTLWGEMATKRDLEKSNALALESALSTQQHLRNVEAIEAMGMLPRLHARWANRQETAVALQVRASARGSLILTLSKFFRMTVQSLVLGLGAWLAIHREITPGLLIAGAILLGRALAPLDLMIGGWRGFVSARGAWRRLGALLSAAPPETPGLPLPALRGAVHLEKVTVTPAGAGAPVLKGVSLDLDAGLTLGIIGPSGAGKSTLARTILGLCVPASGSARLDGAEACQWDRERLGDAVGYLPQDVELIDGTVSENIARFAAGEPEKVIEAAQAAGVHELILRLPDGYETQLIGNAGMLSAGQRQRIGIARALYGEPQLVVLDEPNANLDQEGEAALADSLRRLRSRGCTVIVISHRAQLLDEVDRIAVMIDGQVAKVGPREAMLASLQGGPRIGTTAGIPMRAPVTSGATA
jgi:ATP-binding cassette subfamily C protein EexD